MAGQVRLHATSDFRDALVAAAQEAQLDERFVEKDYYVTAVLRIIVDTQPSRAIFKGGTSLSKGWQLIDRFSEDIDLFIDPEVKPALSKPGTDRELRKLRDAVARHPALTYIDDEGRTSGGLGREDYFGYSSLFDQLPGLRPVVLLEPGIQSGRQPTEDVQISSIVGDFLRRRGDGDLADDLEPFQMTLLHFRRTFVEKLFTVHGKICVLVSACRPAGRRGSPRPRA